MDKKVLTIAIGGRKLLLTIFLLSNLSPLNIVWTKSTELSSVALKTRVDGRDLLRALVPLFAGASISQIGVSADSATNDSVLQWKILSG